MRHDNSGNAVTNANPTPIDAEHAAGVRTRRIGRWCAIAFAFLFGGYLIWFCEGWAINHMPAPWVGYFVIGIGVLALSGVNVWYGGPLDKRKDRPPTA